MAKRLSLMVSKKMIFVYFFSACLFFLGCQGENKHTESVENTNVVENTSKSLFIPDTTVNGKLVLDNYHSLEQFYHSSKELKLIEFIRESPVVAFCNASRKEYLLAYQYEGSTQNAFNCFEVGYYDEKIKEYTLLNDSNGFTTESGLRLGLTLKEVERIKGTGYSRQRNNIVYQINDPGSDFLQNHNMPSYFLECELLQDKVVRIKFGFTYP
jgi:hypothetical protein